ncbi:MAG: YidH family protein [Rhodanobacteraceae bacterium]
MSEAGPGAPPASPHGDDAHNLQVQVARELVELSLQRSYMNTERTLAVWTRTALSLMIFGIAVDRFGLLMRHPPWHVTNGNELLPNPLSTLGGVVLVALGVAILLAAGFRFLAYGLKWYRRNPRKVWFHTPWLAFTFAMLMAAFGIALLVVLCVFRQ